MNRRRVVLVATVLTLLTCAAVGSWLVYRATQASSVVRAYHQVTLGMHEDEVARILQPDFMRVAPSEELPLELLIQRGFDSRFDSIVVGTEGFDARSRDERLFRWVCVTHTIYLHLDRTGNVTGKALLEFPQPTLFERVKQG